MQYMTMIIDCAICVLECCIQIYFFLIVSLLHDTHIAYVF